MVSALFSLSLCLFVATQPVAQSQIAESDVLSGSEQQALQSAGNIRSRAKVYLDAAGRRLQTAESSSRVEGTPALAASLKAYDQILEFYKTDLSKVPPKKRDDLKKDELILRKYLGTLETIEARLGAYEREPLQESKRITRELRFIFLGTFFGPGTLKPPPKE